MENHRLETEIAEAEAALRELSGLDSPEAGWAREWLESYIRLRRARAGRGSSAGEAVGAPL